MKTQQEFINAITEGKKLVSKDGQRVESDPVIDRIWFCSKGFTTQGIKLENMEDERYVVLLGEIGSKDTIRFTYAVGVFRIDEWEVSE